MKSQRVDSFGAKVEEYMLNLKIMKMHRNVSEQRFILLPNMETLFLNN